MSKPTTITIDDTAYIRADSIPNATPTDRQIIVADRGWVFVGNATTDDAGNVTLTDASTIRYWGTTRGLGQLATEGKTDKTRLDPCGTVRVPVGSVIAVFNVASGVTL